ncbi:MAG: hypothetical protein ACTSSP_04720 [Candidatus Asgardarchaeia archaeon]
MKNGSRLIDLTGKRFGKLVVTSRSKKYSRAGTYWDCECDCGETKVFRSDVIRKHNLQSCGCVYDHIKIGERYGNLTVLERAKRGQRSYYWRCSCDCGKEIVLTSHTLKYGSHRSCGCLQNPVGQDHPCYKGYKDLSGGLFHKFEFNASRRKLSFRVTKKYLWKLFEKQNRKCALSGINLDLGLRSRKEELARECTASLDRVDNTRGYMKGNVQWVHKHINKMKNIHSQDYFIKLCKLVANNN